LRGIFGCTNAHFLGKNGDLVGRLGSFDFVILFDFVEFCGNLK
jgi:hypothetical protein